MCRIKIVGIPPHMTNKRLECGVSHARTRASSSPNLHVIKPPIFICVMSQFQSNDQSDPGAAALVGLGGVEARERGRQGGRSVHPPVCLRWQRKKPAINIRVTQPGARKMRDEEGGEEEKRHDERERGGEPERRRGEMLIS